MSLLAKVKKSDVFLCFGGNIEYWCKDLESDYPGSGSGPAVVLNFSEPQLSLYKTRVLIIIMASNSQVCCEEQTG